MSYAAIQKKILKNQHDFEKMLKNIQLEPSLENKQRLAIEAMFYALLGSTGYYSSDIIENVFLEVAQLHTVECDAMPHQKNTVLHVMTQSFNVGGHTRVAERWIELSDANQKHSLIFTEHENHQVPERLANAIKNKQGSIIKLPDQYSNLEKGLELRKIASEYELIILHIHHHDVVPLIAFGHEEFKRPVAFFNHSDHKFWLGASISDVVIDFRIWGEKICFNKRGIKNNFILTLPLDLKSLEAKDSQAEIRQRLRLATDKKIIVSVGANHKYKPMANFNFFSTIKQILKKNSELEIILIGPTYDDFPELKSDPVISRHVQMLGYKNPDEMFNYLQASDLVIDSFPMSGGTALLDAVSCKKPVLSLQCPTGQLDYIMKSQAYCANQEILLQKAHAILTNPQIAQDNIQNVTEQLYKNNSITKWQAKFRELYQKLAQTQHKLTTFKPSNQTKIDDLDVYLYVETPIKIKKWNIPYILSAYKVLVHGRKYTAFRFFNCYELNTLKETYKPPKRKQ